MGNKNIFASNLKKYMEQNGKSRKDMADAIGVSYYTFTSWVTGQKYPRMDKVEMLANYFGILKSDLIEEKPENWEAEKEKNSRTVTAVMRIRKDGQFAKIVDDICKLDDEQLALIEQLIKALPK